MKQIQKKKTIQIEAPAWRRLIAFGIDYIILSTFILFPFERLLQRHIGDSSISGIITAMQAGHINITAIIFTSVLMSIIAFLYFVILEARFKQTIGKIIMKIEITHIKQSTVIKLNQVVIRTLVIIAVYIAPIVALVDAIPALFTKEKQRFLERISNTKTIMKVSI